ncbi:MAG: M14 family zinc carboxypeptidase [Gemmatimonadota bacterium]
MHRVLRAPRDVLAMLVIVLLSNSALPMGAPAQQVRDGDEPAPTYLSIADEYRVAGLDDRRFDHAEYWGALQAVHQADEAADDRIASAEVGRSIEGRAIRALTFGDGPTTVLLWSQMHGDESAASMSLADILHWVAASPPGDPLRRLLEDRLTVTMIPMLNPDGAERFIRHNAIGVDVNRDARRLATPEGRILKAVRDSIGADFGFNLHDQLSRTAGRDGELVAIALLAPAADEARSWGPARQRARHLSAAIAAALAPEIPGRIARYDDAFTPRAFGDNMQAWGTSTVLIESGELPGDPEKQELRRLNVLAILAALEAIADGSVEETPTDHYDDLPMNVGITNDLLLRGGRLVMPNGEAYRVDVAIVYDDGVARTGPRYGEVGDLTGVRAIETRDVTGMYIHPDFGDTGFLRRGDAARLVVRRGPEPDSEAVMRFP